MAAYYMLASWRRSAPTLESAENYIHTEVGFKIIVIQASLRIIYIYT